MYKNPGRKTWIRITEEEEKRYLEWFNRFIAGVIGGLIVISIVGIYQEIWLSQFETRIETDKYFIYVKKQ